MLGTVSVEIISASIDVAHELDAGYMGGTVVWIQTSSIYQCSVLRLFEVSACESALVKI